MAITTKFETRDDTCRLFKCFLFKFILVVKEIITQDVTVMGLLLKWEKGSCHSLFCIAQSSHMRC